VRLLDLVTKSMTNANSQVDESWVVLFEVVLLYSKIFTFSPTSTELSLQVTSSSSNNTHQMILNTLAFSFPSNPISKQIFQWLVSTIGTDGILECLITYDTMLESGKLCFDDDGTELRPKNTSTMTEDNQSDNQMQPLKAWSKSYQSLSLSSSSLSLNFLSNVAKQLNIHPLIFCRYVAHAFFTCCSIFNQQLTTTDDQEFFEYEKILPLTQIKDLIKLLKVWLRRVYISNPIDYDDCYSLQSSRQQFIIQNNSNINSMIISNMKFNPLSNDTQTLNTPRPSIEAQMISQCQLIRYQFKFMITKLFQNLLIRNERRSYLDHYDYEWSGIDVIGLFDINHTNLVNETDRDDMDIETITSSIFSNPHLKNVLTCIPQVISFPYRLKIFQELLKTDTQRGFESLQIQVFKTLLWTY
jgi:hypothetical protein